jgi:ribonuclease Z
MKRLGIVIAALVLAAIGAVALFQRQIGEALYQRAVSQIAGRDASANLPDGLHVFICGSGSPFPDAARAGPCIGVLAGEKAFVFDVGSGSVRKLLRMGFPMAKLDRIYLTHLHSDHIDGLGEALLQSWIGAARTTPTIVAGPAGTDEIVAGFNAAYRIDSTYRVAHHGAAIAPPDGFGGVAQIIAIAKDGEAIVFNDGGVRITAFSVSHEPVHPAFGFRIDYKDRSVVISGDTVYDANLVANAKDADLLLHDAMNKTMVAQLGEALAARGQANTAKIMRDIQDYHASAEDAARAAKEAGARRLALYHTVPPVPGRYFNAAFKGDAEKVFGAQVDVTQDGDLYVLPAGAKTITRKRGALR